MKIKELLELLKEYHLPYTEQERTRDLVLCGDIEQECTGVATTCCATLEVMQKAVEKGINFIISHEGITYNYEKGKVPVSEVENEVLQYKLNYASEHGLVVWRDHDHMHGDRPRDGLRIRPDMIFYGTMKELGWEEYVVGDSKKPLLYKIPQTTVKQLAQDLMKAWNLNGLRVVGNTDCLVSSVFIAEHVIASQWDGFDISKMDMIDKADVFIPLEIVDYTLTSCVRDAATMGKNKAILEMGHFNAEELGMKYLARELKEVFKEVDTVEFIQSGDTFSYLLRE